MAATRARSSRVRIRRLSLRGRLILYGAVPLLLTGGLAALYYSGNDFCRRLVSPDIAWVRPDSQREFGLLESLENLVLLGVAGVLVAGVLRKKMRWERVLLWLLIGLAAFQFLEETDYGMHYVELIGGGTGAGPRGVAGFYNVHRIGYTETVLQSVAEFGLLTFFGAFAIVFADSRRPILRYLAPDRFAILAILLVTAVQEVVWRVRGDFPAGYGSLAGNEIEFAELGVYYLALLYAVDLVFLRDYAPPGPPLQLPDTAA